MPATFTDIAKSRYVLLTTFTKDGRRPAPRRVCETRRSVVTEMSPDLLSRRGTSAYRAATAPHNSTTAQQPAVVAHPHSETTLLMRSSCR